MTFDSSAAVQELQRQFQVPHGNTNFPTPGCQTPNQMTTDKSGSTEYGNSCHKKTSSHLCLWERQRSQLMQAIA